MSEKKYRRIGWAIANCEIVVPSTARTTKSNVINSYIGDDRKYWRRMVKSGTLKIVPVFVEAPHE